MKRLLFILLFCSLTLISLAQSEADLKRSRDSLMTLPDDSVKLIALIDLYQYYRDEHFIECMKIANYALDLSAKTGQFKAKARLLNHIGDGYFNMANYSESFKYYYSAYKLSDSIGSKFYVALSSYNLGWQTAIQQKSYKDVSYLYKSLNIGRELKSDKLILMASNALGSFYTDKYEREKKKNDFDSAVHYFGLTIERNKTLKRFTQAGALYSNMGQLFLIDKDYQTAMFYFNKALDLFANDSDNIVSNLHKVALCKEPMNDKSVGKTYEFVYAYATKRKMQELRKDALQSLKNYYYKERDFQKSYDYQKLYYELTQEINGEFAALSIKNFETNYNYIKSEAANQQLKQASEIQELKNKRSKTFIVALIGFALVVLVIAYLLYKQNKLKHATNIQLFNQNKIISEKKLEIEQSIEYARGIQTAFLPSTEEFKILVKNSFILYKPKDVVSGDFYWYSATEKGILIACADCTGHGVPGALMSMVGINTLQQLCVERKLSGPGTILKYLNAEIKNSLKQNSDQSIQRDGMDIALIHLDLGSKKLIYAGANRPLYLLRKGEVIEYKATKHAIGGFTKYDQTFEEIKIDLEKDDFICLSTDGYADQFGGPDGKKLMTKRLKELLLNISALDAQEQLSKLEAAFNNWKGDNVQIDDVCLIGLKV